MAKMAKLPITVRSARASDADTLIEFNAAMAMETEKLSLDRDVLARGVRAALADAGKGVYFVAEMDTHIVGQLMITREWSDWRNGWFWWIQSVYVAKEARRAGVFRALYRHVEAAASSVPSVIGIRLNVERENATAQATYRRLGLEWTAYQVMEKYPL